MQVYNKVISARSGIAVVPLSGNSCRLWRSSTTNVSEIRAGDLHNCQSCGDLSIIRKINLLSSWMIALLKLILIERKVRAPQNIEPFNERNP